MADLQFVDQHNMVACLERSDENDEFHHIFWATAKSKTVNDVKQIHATIDGKTMVISESSVKSDLHFNDEDGITCLSNDEIFINLALMGRTKRGWDTEISQSSGPPKKVSDESAYTREDNRVVRAATTASSLEVEQESGNIHKTRPTTTLNEPSPQGLGSGSEPKRQDTTLGVQMLRLGLRLHLKSPMTHLS
ncbi:hypothetical protein Tco_1138269 [Tanacetum coccineum]